MVRFFSFLWFFLFIVLLFSKASIVNISYFATTLTLLKEKDWVQGSLLQPCLQQPKHNKTHLSWVTGLTWNGGGDGTGGQEGEGRETMWCAWMSVRLCIYTTYLHIHMHCLLQLGVNMPGHMCFILFAPHLSFPLPNPKGETRRGELAQSEPGPLVHKSLHSVVQGVSLSRKPSWTPLSIPSTLQCSHNSCHPCTGSMLFNAGMFFPAECITLSSLYPHHLYSAAHIGAR